MIELTYELYLEGVSHGITPNPKNIISVGDRCEKVSHCEGCPFDLVDEYHCIIEVLDNAQSLVDSYYQITLKNNPEYLL
jgi:hypothetical protein